MSEPNIDYPQLELIIKKDQEQDKKGLTQNFITRLNQIVNDAYETPKNKKDNFVCKEKTKGDLLKLYQSTKMFKNSDNVFANVQYLAVAEKDTKEIGKIVSLNILNKTVEYFTYKDQNDKAPNRTAHWRDVILFDYNSVQMEAVVIEYKRNNPNELSFNDLYTFLSVEDVKKYMDKKGPADFGNILSKSEDSPVMKAIMEKYDIPLEAVAPQKRKLHCLDAKTLQIIESYESVKEAASKLSISASTISNVLCLGFSARNYLEAGGFKWKYSDTTNFKYNEDFSAQEYYPKEWAAKQVEKV